MTTSTPAEVEAQIHAIMQARVEAVHAKDAARLVAHHDPDVLAYDLLEPLQYKGVADLRRRVQQWFDGYDGPMTYEIRDLQVVAGYDAAFCHGLHHVAGKAVAGQTIDMWWRATQGFRRIDGQWRIVHEHSSVPFDMTSGKVSFDLKP
jgi:ketosteroid isomerase-like protein